jgi:hypothetical protein
VKVKELIKLLQNMPQELEVYGMSDHGQQPEKACNPQIMYTLEDGRCAAEGYTVYTEEAEEYGYEFKAVLL